MRVQAIAGSHEMGVQSFRRDSVAADPRREKEHEPICKQEEMSRRQLRSMKTGRKWQFNGFVSAKESDNWRRLSYRQRRKVRMAGAGKKGVSKNLMSRQKHKRSRGQRVRQRIVVRDVVRQIKVDQEPDEVEKGRMIEREEVWKISCA